ncbi:MAG: VCBS repeat-containing protein [Emticicia sp.]|nr:VCBS repeat-containing protein [Emticicia sp.]
MKNTLLIILTSIALFSCKKEQSEPQLFEKSPSSKTNITFANNLPKDDSLNILDYLYYYNGGGVAAGDINNDGKTDLYFVSNRGENKLYLNKGTMNFEDITEKAGVKGKSNWKTGVSMVDINGDGWLDIYVNVVGNYKGMKGKNELYINNQNGTFSEKAAEYGLDFKGFATQTTFFDFDKDGDLDCYILTHAVHSVSSYDRVSARSLRDGEAGDYLMRNDSPEASVALTPNGGTPHFTNISKQAGIYGAAMGYGLGIVTADINNDGWDDIYVSNDFHEDDYYYINQKDGTFKESIKENFRHISKYSMGCDVADVNNDGYLDVFTTDMHPQDETVEKLSLGEDAYDIYLYKLQFGFYNQYSRNCLQLSQKGKLFSDISPMAGISSTDWSWSPLLADFDNDGIKDLFVSNGIPHRPNNMDYIKYLSNDTDSSVLHSIPVFGQKVKDNKAIEKMPDGKVANFIYKGTDGWKYIDKSANWGFKDATASNGAIYADLDNDGDLDIISNDLDSPAGIYENKSEKINGNNQFLKVKLEGTKGNNFGIGAKVYLKNKGTLQYIQQQPIRGFMSSNDPILHFGLADKKAVDSVVVIWPNGKMEIKTNVKANQTLALKQTDALLDGSTFRFDKDEAPLVEEIPNYLTNAHRENEFIDFIREPLIPFLASSEGPKIAVGDVNNDGLEDFYQCGARNKRPFLMLQDGNGVFKESNQNEILNDSTYEDTDALLFDADGDKDLDLYVVSGGNEYLENMVEIKDRLYLNDGKGNFKKKNDAIKDGSYPNKSCVKPNDFDNDGDIDLFVGGRTVSSNYGEIPESFLLVNDGKGKFSNQTPEEMKKIGMVTNAVWVDMNNDKVQDLVVVGEWMGIKTFINKNKKLVLEENGLEKLVGFWYGLSAADFDADGDMDLVVGNLGTNSKYIKQENPKMRMYANDMDGNGMMEQILAYQKSSEWYPAATRDDLSRMAPALINHRFPNYADYAGKTIQKLFTKEELDGKNAKMYEVNTFESVYIENKGDGEFEIKNLPRETQISKIFALTAIDIDGDKKPELLAGGNLYGVSTYQGRYDASYGLVLKFVKNQFVAISPTSSGFILNGEVRDIKIIKNKGQNAIIVGKNNQTPQFFRLKGL